MILTKMDTNLRLLTFYPTFLLVSHAKLCQLNAFLLDKVVHGALLPKKLIILSYSKLSTGLEVMDR